MNPADKRKATNAGVVPSGPPVQPPSTQQQEGMQSGSGPRIDNGASSGVRPSPTHMAATMQSRDDSEQVTCVHCKGTGKCSSSDTEREAEKTEPPKTTDTRDVGPVNRAPKKYRDMASQTDSEEKPILRTEFDYQSDYTDRKIAGNERKVNDLNRWRSSAQTKLKEVDLAGKRNSKSVEEIKTRQNRDKADMERYKDSVEARLVAMFELIGNKDEASTNNANPSALGVVAVDDDDDDDGEGSVWDIPHEQSTPYDRELGQVQNAEKALSQADRRGSQGGRKDGAGPTRALPNTRGGGDRVNGSGRNDRYDAREKDSQKSYRLNIEVADEASDYGMCTASSGSDQEAPAGKKMRYEDGRGGGTTGSGQPSGGGRPQRGRSMTPIVEERGADSDAEHQEDASWSDMVDEAEGYYSMDATGTDDARGSRNGGRQASRGIVLSNGDRRIVVPANATGPGRPSNSHGESGNTNGVNRRDNNGNGQRPRADSYAEVAESGDDEVWSVADGKGNKRKMVREKQTGLKGLKTVSQREVYVQGIDCRPFNSHAAVEKEVKGYCKDKGITVLFIKVIPVKLDPNQVGCKLAVIEADFERVMRDDFWPEFVSVRAWVYRPREGRGQAGPNA